MRRYLIAGILAFAPIGATIWALTWIIQRLDSLILPKVLEIFFPDLVDPPRLPFVGVIFTLLFILLFGVAARHLFGMEIIRWGERLLNRVPVARTIYGAVKQLAEAIFRPGRTDNFRRVALIEYPRKGVYALAFVTGPARGAVGEALGSQMVNCFVPTTPNPTSGFYLVVKESELVDVDLGVEDAFKIVMSAGIVNPEIRAGSRLVSTGVLTEETKAK